MVTTIARLRPREGSYDKALAAFRAASFRTCLAELHIVDTVAAAALRGRAFLRSGRPGDALEAVNFAADTDRDRAELALLRAVATSRMGVEDATRVAFTEARAYGISAGDVAIETELDFYLALQALEEADVGDAREVARRALTIATSANVGKSFGCIPLPHLIARTQVLLGVIDATDGDYSGTIGHTRRALATLDSCSIRDAYEEAYAMRNLAVVSRDFDLEADAVSVAARLESFVWSDELQHVRFTTLEETSWCAALRGDVVETLRRFRKAAGAATAAPEHVLIAVDRAIVAREVGHRAMAMEEIEHALELSSTFDWETSPGASRVTLLFLAQAAAAIAPARARQTLDRYNAIRNALAPTYAARLEARVRAEEAFATGLVLRAETRMDASTERLTFAFETWKRIGYEWRAARAAIELAELHAGDVFRLAVHRELRQRPDSVFADRGRRVA